MIINENSHLIDLKPMQLRTVVMAKKGVKQDKGESIINPSKMKI